MIFALLVLILLPATAEAATRYASRTGSGVACTVEGTPCTVATAISQAVAGDTVILKDNASAYTGSTAMISVIGKNGTAQNRITIRAETDGGVLINGEFTNNPIFFQNSSFITLEGVNAKHGALNGVLRVSTGTSDIIVREVVAWDTRMDYNLVTCSTQSAGHTLFEDVACFGVGRKTFSNSQSFTSPGHSFTCRRCFGRWEGSTNVGPKMSFSLVYNSRNFTCENCIAMWTGESMPETYFVYNGANKWPATSYGSGDCQSGFTNVGGFCQGTNFLIEQPYGLLAMDRMDDANKCVNAKLYGSLAIMRTSDRDGAINGAVYFTGVSCIDIKNTYVFMQKNRTGFQLNTGSTLNASNTTSVRPSSDSIAAAWTGATSRSSGTTISAVPSPWTTTSPGANLCKRYVDGAQTSEPLWPWPMNARIMAATAAAGAYTGPCTDCTGGRLTRTEFDLTATVASLLGPIPSTCLQDGTEPEPTPPLTVEAPSSIRAPISDRPSVGADSVTDRPTVTRPTP